MSVPSTLDPPFLAPIVMAFDLPFPPSTNELWRSNRGRVHLSKVYTAWIKEAFGLVQSDRKNWSARVKLNGHFSAAILLNSHRRIYQTDGDNRVKACLDLAQRLELIKNDSLCDSGVWSWVAPDMAPHGARLILRSVA